LATLGTLTSRFLPDRVGAATAIASVLGDALRWWVMRLAAPKHILRAPYSVQAVLTITSLLELRR
jgi:hypothetical protein